jgi:metal-responsive CopG/Arc/MetJ family transcriptional regulator
MARAQIYLRQEELELLDRAAQRTGASRSELVRRAVRSAYGEYSQTERLKALEATSGVLHGMDITGYEYVESVRGDLNESLSCKGLA